MGDANGNATCKQALMMIANAFYIEMYRKTQTLSLGLNRPKTSKTHCHTLASDPLPARGVDGKVNFGQSKTGLNFFPLAVHPPNWGAV